jgi:hypothetical protein
MVANNLRFNWINGVYGAIPVFHSDWVINVSSLVENSIKVGIEEF